MASKPKQQLELKMDEEVASGTYSNMMFVNHTENEFVIDFAFMPPGTSRATVHSRIISSPQHTKSLMQVLQRNIKKYERKFGTIQRQQPKPSPDKIH